MLPRPGSTGLGPTLRLFGAAQADPAALSMLIVRELLPPESNAKPRETLIASLVHAADVPWIKEKGTMIHVHRKYVYCDGLAIAKIEYEAIR